VTLGPRFCQGEDGDWCQWTSNRYFGGETKTLRVESYKIDKDWQPTFNLREVSATIFDPGVFQPDYSVATPSPTPPDVGSPSGAAWALAAVTLTGSGASVPALEITGAASDDDHVEVIIFEYWKSDGVINPVTDPDDPTWTVHGRLPPTTTKVDITAIEPTATYYGAVTYVVSGFTGDRLVLGPVTAGALTVNSSSTLTAAEAIVAANFVNIFASSGAKVQKANATDDTKPANGFAPAAISNGATGSVQGPGKISGLSGLTPGAIYYLSTTPGAITATAPTGAGNLVQEVGVAVSATELLFHPKQGVTL
jgi:hypothetical protein